MDIIALENMKQLGELARSRIVRWMQANPQITQAEIGRAVGHTQGWVSRYKLGTQDADLDQLDAMARVFGHTLAEALDLRPDPKEGELLDAFRELRPEGRELAVKMLRQMVPPTAKRGRTRR